VTQTIASVERSSQAPDAGLAADGITPRSGAARQRYRIGIEDRGWRCACRPSGAAAAESPPQPPRGQPKGVSATCGAAPVRLCLHDQARVLTVLRDSAPVNYAATSHVWLPGSPNRS
jgi:hypothetical protein